jgi:hypothetical protein
LCLWLSLATAGCGYALAGRGSFLPTDIRVLNAEITSITLSPVAFTATQLASRYQFVLTMKVDFVDSRENKSLWANDALSFTGEYDLTSGTGDATINAATFVDQQVSSFDRIATDVARTVVTAIVEAF